MNKKPISTILVVDDDEDTRDLFIDMLYQYNLTTAESTLEALRIIENHPPDIVITDVKMPGDDGLVLLSRIKQNFPNIIVIVVTGHGEKSTIISSIRGGAFDYLEKPVDCDEFLHTIDRADKYCLIQRELKESEYKRQKTIKELQKANCNLKETTAQLIQSEKLAALGEIATGIAHEINQPLAGISLTSAFLKKAFDMHKLRDDDFCDSLKDINDCIKRISNIINHMRTFARQDNPDVELFDIHETIDGALMLLEEQLRLHEIEVKKNYDRQLPVIVGSSSQLEQVWINFITNSRDSLDEKGESTKTIHKTITITTKHNTTDNTIDVSFTDNGMGMTEEVKGKMFDPFFTTKEVGKGTGLGLSVSHGIISSHKGTFEVNSQKGEGVTIKTMFPIESCEWWNESKGLKRP